MQDEGVALTQRSIVNFTGAGVTATDDGGNFRTVITIPGASGGHVIAEEGSALISRPTLNFIGTGVTAADDSANNRTNVSIPGGGGGWTVTSTPPIDAQFSWINQDSAAISSSSSGTFLSRAGGGSDAVRGRVKTIPFGPPRQLTLGMIPAIQYANYNAFGMILAEAGASPKLYFYAAAWNNTPDVRCYGFNSPTSFASVTELVMPHHPIANLWLRVRDDGTNIAFSWSADGMNFLAIKSVTRASFLANPAQWGFGINSTGGSVPLGGLVFDFREENV